MTRGVALRRILILLALVPLAGCGDDGAADSAATTSVPGAGEEAAACAGAVDDVGAATERYVRGFRSASTEPIPVDDATTPATSHEEADVLDEAGYQAALGAAQDRITDLGCDPAGTRTALAERMARVEAEGPVADAVLRQITASLTGRLATEPADTSVTPADDLWDVLARSPHGSVVRLGAGEYRLDSTLVLLSGVEIIGAGRDETTIVSTAPDATVLAVTDQRVTLRSVSFRHEGEAPASVLMGGPAASIAVSEARFTGGRTDADGQGGAGILMFATGGDASGTATTLEVTDTELVGNQAAGAVLSGGHRTSVVRSRFEGNGQCGVCFLDAAGGSVEDSEFTGNAVGVASTGSSRPSLLRIVVDGGEVGLQAADDAAPVMQDATFSAMARAALIFSGRAAGSLDGVTCSDVPFGIVVGPDVTPSIGETDCEVARSES